MSSIRVYLWASMFESWNRYIKIIQAAGSEIKKCRSPSFDIIRYEYTLFCFSFSIYSIRWWNISNKDIFMGKILKAIYMTWDNVLLIPAKDWKIFEKICYESLVMVQWYEITLFSRIMLQTFWLIGQNIFMLLLCEPSLVHWVMNSITVRLISFFELVFEAKKVKNLQCVNCAQLASSSHSLTRSVCEPVLRWTKRVNEELKASLVVSTRSYWRSKNARRERKAALQYKMKRTNVDVNELLIFRSIKS